MIYHHYIDEDGNLYIETDPFCLPATNADSDFNQKGYLPSIEECLDLDSDQSPEDYDYVVYEPGTAYTGDCY